MAKLLVLLLVAFASALVPLINIEAYLGVGESLTGAGHAWTYGFVAGFGQMVGKVIWYYIGASSLNWEWVRRKIEKPKQQARLARWRDRTHDRPLVAGGLVFVSALTGLPPFAILSVLAGQLRMSLTLFFLIGLAGRWLRFALVILGFDLLNDLWLS